MFMRYLVFLSAILCANILLGSCSEEKLAADKETSSNFEEGELTLASLKLAVNSFEVNVQSDSRAPEDTEAERAIHDIWVFQFDATENQNLLINPRYYTIANQSELDTLQVWLKPNITSTVYIVANTNQPNWITDETDVSSRANLEAQELYNLDPQFTNEGKSISIPMTGYKDNVTINEESGTATNEVTIPVTRMFAKLCVKANISIDYMTLRSIGISQIPKASKVTARTGEGDDKTDYKDGFYNWYTTTFDLNGEEEHIVYVAENMQGSIEIEEDNNSGKNEGNAPAKALRLTVEVDRKDPDTGENTQPNYVVYPGGNVTTDFNIKRNCIYNVTINITSDKDVHIPSSNCFVVVPGKLLSFEPYYREEKGGGYNFKDYLDVNDETGKKVIDKVEIIWQSKDAIGDNSNGDLVWYNPETQKIYVKTNTEGNALIAAYNKYDEIIWSWHIWVTDHDPANLSNAVRYTTYEWDSNGIYPDRPRTSGLAVMSCNLGALANEPENAQDTKPFGMLYQWGRKDPFPPVLKGNPGTYTVQYVGEYYDNSNEQVVGMTSDEDPTQLFHSISGTDMLSLPNPVYYAIQHPTVFICGTKEVKKGEQYVENILNYVAEGDWNYRHDDKLWGGLRPVDDGSMEKYTINSQRNVHIYDNYGSSKTIFDPCPYGWRTAPGELWLGFTKTGLNPTIWDEVNNYPAPGWNPSWWGTYIYMQSWKGENGNGYTYFPNQGTRVGDGYGMRVGSCGNYHNATTDSDNRVNILHIHNTARLFHIFEFEFPMYYVKSVAGPIRCVRDPNPGQ